MVIVHFLEWVSCAVAAKVIKQGMLKKNAKRKASASGFDIADSMSELKATVSTALRTSTACHIADELNKDAKTPSADSFPIAEATKAIKSCHGNPKKRVTGSIKVPIL